MPDLTLEERVAHLEREMVELKQRAGSSETVREWLARISTRLKNYPEFQEVIRLGREIRETYPSDTEA